MIHRSCNPAGPSEQRLFGTTATLGFMEALEGAFCNVILFKSQHMTHVVPASGYPSSTPGLRVAKANKFSYPSSESVEFQCSLKENSAGRYSFSRKTRHVTCIVVTRCTCTCRVSNSAREPQESGCRLFARKLHCMSRPGPVLHFSNTNQVTKACVHGSRGLRKQLCSDVNDVVRMHKLSLQISQRRGPGT